MGRFIDLKGQVFGFWSVLCLAFKKGTTVYWRCRCSCGTEANVRSYSLRQGKSTKCKSCGTVFANTSYSQLCAEIGCNETFEAKTPHSMFCSEHRGIGKNAARYRKRDKSRAYAILGNRCSSLTCGWVNEDGTKGCTDRRCLNVDHVNSDGANDRKRNYGSANRCLFYGRVLKTPERFQLLCCNCNWIKRHTHNEVTSYMD